MAELIQGWLQHRVSTLTFFFFFPKHHARSDISHKKERQEVGRLRDQQLQEILMRMSRGMQLDNSRVSRAAKHVI